MGLRELSFSIDHLKTSLQLIKRKLFFTKQYQYLLLMLIELNIGLI
jgi:hypothetical protein